MVHSSHASRRSMIPFWVCAIVLLMAAIAMEPAIAQVRKYFTKLTIDIRKPLAKLDRSAIPSFTISTEAKTLYFYDQDIETGDKITLALTRRTPTASGIYPEAVLHMAYYSDPRHQVAHTPEVCFRQDGGVINGLETIEVNIPDLIPDRESIPVRYVDIQRTPTARVIDLYTFISNGKFYSDRDRLRLALGMPGDRYVYFCKVEVAVPRTDAISDAEANEIAVQVLREVVPLLLKDHLPTRAEVMR